MAFQPFLIADLKTGKDIGKEPWLIPQDAFDIIVNARVDKGVLTKRPGYAKITQTGQTNAIMGFTKAFSRGTSALFVNDTKRFYKFEPTIPSLTDVGTGDIFTGGDYHYFRYANWLNKIFMTNWHNPIYQWDDIKQELSETDTGDVTINRAAIIFVWKNRLHAINTVEAGNDWTPTRWRWSDVLGGSTSGVINFSTSNYIDGEFDDTPQCVGFIRGTPHIFFKSFVVPLRPTRVSSAPFAWGDKTALVGSATQNFCVEDKDGVFVWNPMENRNIDYYDGYRGVAASVPRLRDIVDTMDIRRWHYMNGIRSRSDNAIWLSYATDGSDYPDRIIEYNLIESSFVENTVAMHCLYGFDGWFSPSWDEAPNVYDEDLDENDNVSAINLSSEFNLRIAPAVYGGDRSGNVYNMESGTDYNGSTIPVDIRTSRLNPFQEQGKQVRLRNVEYLVTTDAGASYTAAYFKNQDTSAFKSISLTTSGSGDKHWENHWIGGEKADFFKIKLSHTAKANEPKIHAIRLWFQPVGTSWQK